MFKLKSEMLEIMDENPKARFWGSHNCKEQEEKYLQLQRLLLVDYTYFTTNDMN